MPSDPEGTVTETAGAHNERADPITAARERNERAITVAIVALAGMGIVIAGWRTLTIESAQGSRILAFGIAIAALYAASLARKGPPSHALVWLRVTVEVSSATIVQLLDAQAGAAYIVSSSTFMLYPLAILLASLRLRPRVIAYAAVLAIAQHLLVSLYVFADPELPLGPGGLSLDRMYQELAFRLMTMAFMGGMGAWVMATFRKEYDKAGEEDRVRRAFGHYVDRRVVRRVLAGDLRIAPERREVTVLFVDIRNFTRLSENRDAGELFRLLSFTLDAFSQEVQRQGGIVNKYLGDGLMAIFGAPETQDDHARRAVRTALNLVDTARRLNESGKFPGLEIGCGMHGGQVVVGDLGGERREFTAIGDVVNVASRIESANKELGTKVLASRYVVDHLGGGAVTRAIPPMALRGREAPVELFEIVQLASAEMSFNALPSTSGILSA
jgi:adenylate cyclase